MKKLILILIISSILLLGQPKVLLQVLGSGGPESGDKRASTGYIVWINGKIQYYKGTVNFANDKNSYRIK